MIEVSDKLCEETKDCWLSVLRKHPAWFDCPSYMGDNSRLFSGAAMAALIQEKIVHLCRKT